MISKIRLNLGLYWLFWGQKEPYSWAHMAVGSEEVVERTKEELGIRAKGREAREMEGQFELCEPGASYQGHFGPKKSDIAAKNTYFWKRLSRCFRQIAWSDPIPT